MIGTIIMWVVKYLWRFRWVQEYFFVHPVLILNHFSRSSIMATYWTRRKDATGVSGKELVWMRFRNYSSCTSRFNVETPCFSPLSGLESVLSSSSNRNTPFRVTKKYTRWFSFYWFRTFSGDLSIQRVWHTRTRASHFLSSIISFTS
jgi:hypothetical protein